jgi:hypothetical protein
LNLELKLKRKNEDLLDRKSKKLFIEANEILKRAIEKKNFEEVDLAHSMLAVVYTIEDD